MLSRAMSAGDFATKVTLSEDDELQLRAGQSTVTENAVLLDPSWRASASLISGTARRLQQTQITPAAQDLLTRRMLRLLNPVIDVVVAAARKHSAPPTRVVIDAKDWGGDDDQFAIIVNVPATWDETDAIWKDIDPGIRALVAPWSQRDRDFLFGDVRIDLRPVD